VVAWGLQCGDAPDIQAGIDLAVDGDTVLVAPGRWDGPLLVSGKTLTLEGRGGADATIADAAGLGSAPYVQNADVTLRGLTVTGGDANIGGGLRISASDVLVDACRIANNRSVQRAGGIEAGAHSGSYSLTLLDNEVARNPTAGRGGGLDRGSKYSVAMEGCSVEENPGAAGRGRHRRPARLAAHDHETLQRPAERGGRGRRRPASVGRATRRHRLRHRRQQRGRGRRRLVVSQPPRRALSADDRLPDPA
jgi:hypothetical protein